jgi:hypothetical protein
MEAGVAKPLGDATPLEQLRLLKTPSEPEENSEMSFGQVRVAKRLAPEITTTPPQIRPLVS